MRGWAKGVGPTPLNLLSANQPLNCCRLELSCLGRADPTSVGSTNLFHGVDKGCATRVGPTLLNLLRVDKPLPWCRWEAGCYSRAGPTEPPNGRRRSHLVSACVQMCWPFLWRTKMHVLYIYILHFFQKFIAIQKHHRNLMNQPTSMFNGRCRCVMLYRERINNPVLVSTRSRPESPRGGWVVHGPGVARSDQYYAHPSPPLLLHEDSDLTCCSF